MDNKSKGDFIAGSGGAILGGIVAIDVLRINPTNDWIVLVLQFCGVLLSAFFTSMVMIVGKYFGESIVDSMKQYFKTRKLKKNGTKNSEPDTDRTSGVA